MSLENPYEPPLTDKPFQADFADGGLWQSGKLLIMRKDAQLPDRCVKSNVPTTRRLKRSLIWHHPAVYLAILANLLIYIILALCLQKKATIRIGLSDKWFWKRRRAIMIGWGSALLSIGLFILAIANIDQNNWMGWLILASFTLFFGGLIYGLVASRMVVAARIDDNYVWLKGVSREFLAELPSWPN